MPTTIGMTEATNRTRTVTQLIYAASGEQAYKAFAAHERMSLASSTTSSATDRLLEWHTEKVELDAVRASVSFDLQAALDGPHGSEWDIPLRIIARYHFNSDVIAPRLYRVNKAFEYCWRLAKETTEINLKAEERNVLDRHSLSYHQQRDIVKQRKALQLNFLASGFRVKQCKLDTCSASKTRQVVFLGATYVHVPSDAVVQGVSAAFVNQV